VNAARGGHTRWQESHLPVLAAIRGTIVTNLVSSGAVKELIRIIGVVKLTVTLILPIVTTANKVVKQGDVHEQIDLLRYSDVEDLKS
jgi:hypothetical protein